MSRHCKFVIDIEQSTDSKAWDLISSAYGAGELLYAVVVYYYHGENYYLDELIENDPRSDKELIDVLFPWIDLFYDQYGPVIDQIKKHKTFNVEKVFFDRHTHSLCILLRAREFDERFQPVY